MYKLYHDKKHITQSESFNEIFKKAMKYTQNLTKHYTRFWVNNNNELTIDYGSHTSFIYIKTDDPKEDLNETLIKHQTKGE